MQKQSGLIKLNVHSHYQGAININLWKFIIDNSLISPETKTNTEQTKKHMKPVIFPVLQYMYSKPFRLDLNIQYLYNTWHILQRIFPSYVQTYLKSCTSLPSRNFCTRVAVKRSVNENVFIFRSFFFWNTVIIPNKLYADGPQFFVVLFWFPNPVFLCVRSISLSSSSLHLVITLLVSKLTLFNFFDPFPSVELLPKSPLIWTSIKFFWNIHTWDMDGSSETRDFNRKLI